MDEVLGSVTDPEEVARALDGVDDVVHLAAKVSFTGGTATGGVSTSWTGTPPPPVRICRLEPSASTITAVVDDSEWMNSRPSSTRSRGSRPSGTRMSAPAERPSGPSTITRPSPVHGT